MEMTDSKRNFGRWTETLEEIHLDAVGREDVGNGLSKFTSVVAAVMTDNNAEVLATWECLEDVVGKALSGRTDNVAVHAVRTRSHDTTQTTCTKLKCLIETVDELRLVFCFQHSLHFGLSFGIEHRISGPNLCHFHTFFQ